MIAQVVARHLRIPGIVLLLLAGVALGPDGLNLVRPESLGDALRMIVGAAVAVILFEGGLHLDIARLRGEAPTIRRLVTYGAVVTAIGGTLAARLFMGWSWEVSILFGTLVIVTGPTVITPLLRRTRVNRNLHTVLEAEGVLIDPIGAIIAVVALELVLEAEFGLSAAGLLGIPTRLVFGFVAGIIGGYAMARILASDRALPPGLESIFTLAMLLLLYSISEAVLPESGIMAAPVAGMVVGNMPSRPSRQLKEFKEQLTVLLLALLFVLLAADVRIAEVAALGWRGIATVLALVAVVRPINVLASTYHSALSYKERAFMAWLAPRGIVAAAVAGLFAEQMMAAGIEEGLELRALVFLVIAATVLLQGLSAGAVAAALGVRRPSEVGYLIAGANPLARALGSVLRKWGEDVVIVDTDPGEAQIARRDGFNVLLGNAMDEEILHQADAEGKWGVVGVIPNDGISLLIAGKVMSEFPVPQGWVAVRAGKSTIPKERLVAMKVRPLFRDEIELSRWNSALGTGSAEVAYYEYVGDEEASLPELLPNRDVLPLGVRRGSRGTPADPQARIRPGEHVALLVAHGAKVPDVFDTADDETVTPE